MANPLLGIVLGSASDSQHAYTIGKILDELGIPFEVTISSAHRTPEDVVSYSISSKKRGIRAIIAVAGLSAALPGVIAAHTDLPVIGVPVASGSLGGIDALLSITQMPPGVPVASVGINGSKNAAILAARILALIDDNISEKLAIWAEEQKRKVQVSRAELQDLPLVSEEIFTKE
ncbi:MAG: 5-(carboxyamino)imidazole ribonucleotide mutase [Synergistales bacterium]|nr:5-(carboxyamino)imidazole ribonucleotide mutase [Synergistales bacterium]